MEVYKRIIKISLPIALQQVIFTSVNFVDTLMIGGALGEVAIAAVGLSNQVFFLYNLILFGLVSGGGIFFLLNIGENKKKKVYPVLLH